eukprot:2321183-Alexandrium_andersonii.AAC.1
MVARHGTCSAERVYSTCPRNRSSGHECVFVTGAHRLALRNVNSAPNLFLCATPEKQARQH